MCSSKNTDFTCSSKENQDIFWGNVNFLTVSNIAITYLFYLKNQFQTRQINRRFNPVFFVFISVVGYFNPYKPDVSFLVHRQTVQT